MTITGPLRQSRAGGAGAGFRILRRDHRPYAHASSCTAESKEGRGRGLVLGPRGPHSNVTRS
ncbi:hypothetical protein MICRO8M_60068 [Microbacterium sp. 8M]|nr:hypothetical protein MICRO8M_60068 [Microbacterium sp. 8M]